MFDPRSGRSETRGFPRCVLSLQCAFSDLSSPPFAGRSQRSRRRQDYRAGRLPRRHRLAIAGNKCSRSSRGELKAWPGRSTSMQVKLSLKAIARSAREWVEAPVPWRSSTTGPAPIICTCQCTFSISTNWLVCRKGQSIGMSAGFNLAPYQPKARTESLIDSADALGRGR